MRICSYQYTLTLTVFANPPHLWVGQVDFLGRCPFPISGGNDDGFGNVCLNGFEYISSVFLGLQPPTNSICFRVWALFRSLVANVRKQCTCEPIRLTLARFGGRCPHHFVRSHMYMKHWLTKVGRIKHAEKVSYYALGTSINRLLIGFGASTFPNTYNFSLLFLKSNCRNSTNA